MTMKTLQAKIQFLMVWFVLATAAIRSVAGQSTTNQGPRLMDRQEEIALALSACPPSVAGKAAVYVLDRAGYIKVRVFLTMWLDGPHRTPQEVNPVVRERVREMVTRALRLSRLAPNCKGLEPHAVGRLAEVHAPTLIILGENDAPDIHAIGQLIHEGVAGSHLAWIREAGHILPMEKANEFNGLVADFLRG